MVLSENQRIEFQIGEKDCHLLSGKEKWNLLWWKNVEDLLDFLQQIRQIEMRQQGWLQENDNLFFGWKSVIISELNFTIKIVAAAFFTEMHDIKMFLKLSGIHVMVRMVLAVFAKARSVAETAQKMMVFGAIVEIHVPSYRNEEHQKRHQWGYYLQNAFFHAANIVNLFDCDVITFFQLFDGSRFPPWRTNKDFL